jgi:hypothetical protein
MKSFACLKDINDVPVCVNINNITKVIPNKYGASDTQSVIWFTDGTSVHINMALANLCIILNGH